MEERLSGLKSWLLLSYISIFLNRMYGILADTHLFFVGKLAVLQYLEMLAGLMSVESKSSSGGD